MIHIELEEIGDEFQTNSSLITSDFGKRLSVEVRYDGNGNSIVRFVVNYEGKRVTFEKFDAAVARYNSAK